MFAFTKLYTINFIKSLAGPFFVIFFPIVLSVLYGSVFRFNYLVPAMVLTPAICASTVIVGSQVADFNTNGFYQRLGLTKLSTSKMIGSIIFFNLLMILASSVINIIALFFLDLFKIGKFDLEKAGQVIQENAFKVQWEQIGFYGYLFMVYAIIFLAVLVVPIGIYIGLRAKDSMNAMFKGLFLFFPITFMSGIFLDFKTLNHSEVIKVITYLIPTRWIVEPAIVYWREQSFANVSEWWMIFAGPLAAIIIGPIFLSKAIKLFNKN